MKDSCGETILFKASKSGRIADVELIIKAEADIEAANKHGFTPLYIAACNGHAAIVQLLKD